MRDALGWSLSLGRWFGVCVRLHILFLLFAVFAIAASLRSEDKDLFGYGLMSLVILLGSVILHEAAHCLAAIAVSAPVERVVLWPLGGLETINSTQDPRQEFRMGVAGPFANLVVSMLVAPILLFAHQNPLVLLNPLVPPAGVEGITVATVSAMTFWINWVLFTVNLIPAFPLDGGRILRALLCIRFDERVSVTIAARVAQGCAVLICLTGILLYSIFPFVWAPLVVFGIFLFFSANQEIDRYDRESAGQSTFGYDFSQGYTSLDKTFEPVGSQGSGGLRAWIEQRREARQQRQQEVEHEEEQQVDVILTRVHQHGIGGLTKAERSLLNRVSQRYRNRQNQ